MPKQIFSRFILPGLAIGLFAFAAVSVARQPERKITDPELPVPAAKVPGSVAGTGVIEPKSETIAIGTNIPGIVTTVHVTVGQQVAAGDPLFTVDERQTKAEQERLRDELEVAQQELADAEDQLQRANRLTKGLSIGESNLERLRFAVRTARATVIARTAAIREADITLERLTVRAPISGTVLRVNIRPGEFAQAGALAEPLMQMGDVSTLHVRVEVDETLLPRLQEGVAGYGTLRGNPSTRIPLTWVRLEPALVPKRNLTGDASEKVDTRVLQAIYAFDPAKAPKAFVGQQMDVFLGDGGQ